MPYTRSVTASVREGGMRVASNPMSPISYIVVRVSDVQNSGVVLTLAILSASQTLGSYSTTPRSASNATFTE